MVNQDKAIKLCKVLYSKIGKDAGYFPALTGGQLYKEGSRKDIDVVIYRHRQNTSPFEMEDIEDLLIDIGFYDFRYFGFVTKAKWKGLDIDLFNPETKELDSKYPEEDDDEGLIL